MRSKKDNIRKTQENRTAGILDYGNDDSTTFYERKKSSDINTKLKICPSYISSNSNKREGIESRYHYGDMHQNTPSIPEQYRDDIHTNIPAITTNRSRRSNSLDSNNNCNNNINGQSIIHTKLSTVSNMTNNTTSSRSNPYFFEPLQPMDVQQQPSNVSSIFKTKNNIGNDDGNEFDRHGSFVDIDNEKIEDNHVEETIMQSKKCNHTSSSSHNASISSNKSRSLLHEHTNKNQIIPPLLGAAQSDSTSETPIKFVASNNNASFEATINNDSKLTSCPNCSSFIIIPRNNAGTIRCLCPNCNHAFNRIFHDDNNNDNNIILTNKQDDDVRENPSTTTHDNDKEKEPQRNDDISDTTMTHALDPNKKHKKKIFSRFRPRVPFRKKKKSSSRKNDNQCVEQEQVKNDTTPSTICLGTDSGIFKVAEGFSSCSESDMQNFIQALQKDGVTVHIFNKNSIKEKQLYLFHENIKYLMIGSPRNTFDLSKCIEIRYGTSIDTLHPNLRGTPTLRGQCQNNSKDLCKSFSIIFSNGTIDILTYDAACCKYLARGFSSLCVYIHLERLKKEYKNNNNNNVVSSKGN